jgi:hypothetical protein
MQGLHARDELAVTRPTFKSESATDGGDQASDTARVSRYRACLALPCWSQPCWSQRDPHDYPSSPLRHLSGSVESPDR